MHCIEKMKSITTSSLSFQNCAFIAQKPLTMSICWYISRFILQSTHCLTSSGSLPTLALGLQVNLRN